MKLDLPEPETPVMQQKVPRGMEAVTPRRLFALAPLGRDLDRPRAGEILAGEAVGAAQDILQGSLRDDLATVDARTRAQVDDMVGMADGILVVLDDDHRVAEITLPLERFQQPVVVALVEADRRFVEHVEHARESRADLAGEADALALAARQRT